MLKNHTQWHVFNMPWVFDPWFLTDKKIDKVYSSNLKRAMETAKIITSNKYPIIKCPEFKERNFGEWQGKLWSNIYREIPDLKKIWKIYGAEFRPPKGESIQEMIFRAQEKFKQIINYHEQEENIIIVSHGGPIKAILGYALSTLKKNIIDIAEQDNCCINILEHNKKLVIKKINYVVDINNNNKSFSIFNKKITEI